MPTENIRIFSLETRGVETVKELKEQIRELRKGLVQLDETSEEYEKQVKDLTNAEETLERVMKSNSKQTVAATGSYNALVEEMSALKRVWREVTTEAERAKIGKRIAEINVQLKAMDAEIGNFQRNVGDYKGALTAVFKTPQQEIKELRKQLAGLTQGTQEYNEVFMRMADLTTKVQKQQELLKYSSADLGNILTNVAGVASSVVGGLSAINAAMGLMGDESEDVQRAMLKVQRMMALVQGLSALENLGPKIQGLWNGIKRFIDGFRGGTAAVGDFNKSLSEADGTMTKVTAEANTQAKEIGAIAAETEKETAAKEKLRNSLTELRAEMRGLNQSYMEEIDAVWTSNMAYEEKTKKIEEIRVKYSALRREMNARFKAENDGLSVLQASVKVQGQEEKQLVKTNNIFKLYKQNVKVAAQGTVQYTAATGAATVATKVLTGAVNALKVALSAIGIGLIIAGLTALLGLLGKGLKALFNWITGVNKAEAAVEGLKTKTEELNKTLEEHEDNLDFESRLMEAQGKEYQEIYEHKKKQITADYNLAKAHLAEAEAQYAAIKSNWFAKSAKKALREEIEKITETVNEYAKALKKLDQELVIHNAQEETNKRNRGGGGGGGSSVNTQLKEAERLYKSLLDWYKTDRQKLKETYEENKKTIEKYIKDKAAKNKALLALEQQYYAELKKIHRDNMAAIYNIYMDQENRRLALMDVWGDKYLERAKAILDEQHKIDLSNAAKKVGFEEKTQEQIDRMDAATKKEYLDKLKLFNNEKFLIDKEYERNYTKLQSEHNARLIEEGRRAIEIKKENAKTDEEVLQAEIELAEYDLATVFKKEGESANEYQLRVIALAKALEELQKKQKESAANKDWTQLRLDNDAESARINNGDQSMQYLQARLKAAQYFYDNLQQLEGESMEEYRQRTLEALSELKDAEQAILMQRLNNYSDLANGIGDIFGSIADLYQTEIEAQKDADGQYNAESRKKFEWVKKLQIAQATIQTISGAIAAFMGCQSLGQPWGAIIGAVQAAAVTAAGIAEIAKIKSTKLDGSGSNTNSTRYAVATPSITDYVPQGTTNLTGGQETQDLANALSKTPIKAYVVESDVTAKQELANRRTSETTF